MCENNLKKFYCHISKVMKLTTMTFNADRHLQPYIDYILYIKNLLSGPQPDDCNGSTTPGDIKTEATTKHDKTDATENPDNKPDDKATDKPPDISPDAAETNATTPATDDVITEPTDDATTPKDETAPTETPSLRSLKKKKSVSLSHVFSIPTFLT